MGSEIKCKKCRTVLLGDIEKDLISAHGTCNNEIDSNICNSLGDKNMLYLSGECVPPWIKTAIEAENWTKGKLNCQCNNRVGSFDFVSGQTCECGKQVLPSIRLIRSKVDYFKL